MRRLWILTTCLVLALLVGCSTEDAGERVAVAQERTRGSGSARVALTQAYLGSATGDFRLGGEGQVDFADGRRVVRMAPVGLGELGDTASFETLFDGEDLYVNAPVLGAPTPWVRLDAAALEPGSSPVQDFSSDPTRSLAFLGAADGEVERVGEEQVRDAATTHYRFTVDVERAAEAVDEEQAAFLRAELLDRGVTRLPAEVWLDDEGRLRRLLYRLELAQPLLGGSATDTGTVETTVEYFDFGVPVDVQAPPAEEVTDFSALLEAQEPPGA